MKTSQNFVLAVALLMSSAIYSAPTFKIVDLEGLSLKIEKLLKEYDHTIDKGTSVTVFFSVAEDNSIQYLSVASKDPGICSKLQQVLEDQKLDGKEWRAGTIYELTVGHTDAPPVLSHI